MTVIINYLLMIYYAMASFTNLRIICSETLNVSLNPIPQPKEWLRWASTAMLKQKQHQKQKNMFLHNFQFASVFKLSCYVFSQKSTYSCACKLEISGNRKPAACVYMLRFGSSRRQFGANVKLDCFVFCSDTAGAEQRHALVFPVCYFWGFYI